VAVALQEVNDRFDRVPVSERAPILSFFSVRRDNIVPESMRMIVRSQPRVNLEAEAVLSAAPRYFGRFKSVSLPQALALRSFGGWQVVFVEMDVHGECLNITGPCPDEALAAYGNRIIFRVEL
jgi:hypothetical protein